MKIATNYEINNKQEMLKRRIREGEEVATWCVEDRFNYERSQSSGLYFGTLKQCQKEAKYLMRNGFDIACITLMTLDKDLCQDFCLDIVEFE